MSTALSLLALCLLQPLAAAAQEIGTLTLVEGRLQVIRGTTVLRGAEGVKLHQGDIIESSNPGFVQLELAGGTVVALGASTRLFLFSHPAGGTGARMGGKATTAELVLLSGWLKGETSPKVGTYRYASPLLAATTVDGTLVLHAAGAVAEIFVESQSAGIGKVSPEGNLGHPVRAKAGQFFSCLAGKSVTANPRPSSTFIESMPRPFRDTLPSRLSRFSGEAAKPQREHEVTYSEVQSWLTIGQTWRKGFIERFQPRLKDAAFRKALEAHLNDYPEWDPILHPKTYPPNTPPAAADSPGIEQRR
jgi:hypothetical protein